MATNTFTKLVNMKQYRRLFFSATLILLYAGTSASKSHLGHGERSQGIDTSKEAPSIVFLITQDINNYEAHKTVPVFAEMLRKKHGFRVTVLLGSGTHGAYRYPGMEALQDADLLIVFVRRIALPVDQMRAIKEYLAKGKPLIGIRTAHHAFAALEKIEAGFEAWPEFTPDILGCINRGYGATEPGTDISAVPEAESHSIMKGLPAKKWHAKGQAYHIAPLVDRAAVVLLEGTMGGRTDPVAWTRMSGESKVFYTSLGHPADFEMQEFISLLTGAIKWALDPTAK